MIIKISDRLIEEDYRQINSVHDCEVILDAASMDEISGEELTNLARISFKNRIRFSAINANQDINETILLLNAIYSFHTDQSREKKYELQQD